MDKLLMLLSSLFFALCSYFAKIVTINTNMSGTITSFSRFAIGIIVMGGYLLYKKQSFKPNNPKTILIRVSLNCIAIILSSEAINFTSITNANMLNMIYPIFVVLLAPLISKENIKKSTYFYLAAVMIGAYLITNPSFNNINLGDAISLASAVFSALSIFALKEAIVHDDGNLVIFYAMIFGTLINLPVAYNDVINFEMSGLLPVLLSGVSGILGMLAQTWSYKTLDSPTGSLISTSRIIISALIGYIFLSEPLNIRIIMGIILVSIALIGVSGYFERYYERHHLQKEEEEI